MDKLEKVIKAWECCNPFNRRCFECPYDADCLHDSFDRVAIADMMKLLKEQQPKKGAWIRHGNPPEYVIECSVCGQKYFNHAMQSLANYCSMCGAKMESWMVENQTEAISK